MSEQVISRPPLLEAWMHFRRNRSALAGLTVLILIILGAIFGPILYPTDPVEMVWAPFSPPGEQGFLLGTDYLGRDLMAMIINGAKVSLLIGLAAAVHAGFEQLRAQAEATAQVHVVSAYALSADAEKAIAEAVQARFKRAVTVTAAVDASLIAGAVIRVGDAVVDLSARGRLNRLALDLAPISHISPICLISSQARKCFTLLVTVKNQPMLR